MLVGGATPLVRRRERLDMVCLGRCKCVSCSSKAVRIRLDLKVFNVPILYINSSGMPFKIS